MLWCSHADCVLSEDSFSNKEALAAHVSTTHSAAAQGPAHPGPCPASILGTVDLNGSVTRGTHPPWYKPVNGVDMGLRMANSLTGEVEPFIPGNGRRVLWYTCGPTVYDTCHMGHARAYLTFDIMRRIVEDYFGYEVLYQINITDIDDKIILRARRNKLIDDYEEKHKILSGDAAFAAVEADCTEALALATQKMQDKLKKLQIIPEDPRARDEQAEALSQHIFKMSQLEDTKVIFNILIEMKKKGGKGVVSAHLASPAKELKLKYNEKDVLGTLQEGIEEAQHILFEIENMSNEETARASALDKLSSVLSFVKLGHTSNVCKAMVEVCRGELGEKLDGELGHSITDHNIFNAHARKFEKGFHDDMAALGVKEPDVLTRVTEYVPQIIDYIDTIVKKGLAYSSGGSVYLDLTAFKQQGHHYRKNEPGNENTSETMMAESEGSLAAEGEKRNVNDFALWKASKPGEPFWDSPWGQGRPGWHIECSVVAGDIMGANMDVHAGGSDLKFPHHDNELAQSEAYYGHHQWVNYFVHAGQLKIKGLKMSKSLKNFIKIKQALKEHSPRQIRMMFLLQPWNKPMNYSDQTVKDAAAKLSSFNSFFGVVKAILRTDWLGYEQLPVIAPQEVGWRHPEDDRKLYMAIADAQSTVHNAFCDNFDTVKAMLAMYDLVVHINAYLRTPERLPAVLLLKKAATYITKMFRVLGLVEGSEDIGWSTGTDSQSVAPFIDALVGFRDRVRNAAREKKELSEFLQASDELRDNTMVELGVKLEDRTGESTLWKMQNVDELKKEIEARQAQEREAAKKKKQNIINKKQKELDKWVGAAVVPAEFFKASGAYGTFDATGMPLTTKDGKEVAKKAGKKLQAQLKKHTTAHASLVEQAKGDIDSFLKSLRDEVAALEADL